MFAESSHPMIQRIQSIYLFLASLAQFSLFGFPVIDHGTPAGQEEVVKVTGVYLNGVEQAAVDKPFDTLTIALIVVALVPLLLIFLFRNRRLQITLIYLAILLVIGFSFWLAETAKESISNANLQISDYNVGAFLPTLAIVLLLLAIRGIRKDEALIKSADRLR
ncbi:MAG: DUF4293 domain-containing protein [Mucilaginibacter polytrichastri]|nr:DUF4293 domain-containing protein [Mucilaginibacter polytrichastri]